MELKEYINGGEYERYLPEHPQKSGLDPNELNQLALNKFLSRVRTENLRHHFLSKAEK